MMTNSAILNALLSSYWALDETVLGQMATIIIRHACRVKLSGDEIAEQIAAARPAGPKPQREFEVRDGVAVVPITGVIAKRAAEVNRISQPRGTSVEQVRKDLRAALADDEVRSILLSVDSPGGSVDGIAELAEEIRQARGRKLIVAHADGMMASGAYWLASQATEIVATPSAEVGSIGVYSVACDYSRWVENEGAKVHVIRAGAMKGTGVFGAPLTADQLADIQRVVDSFYELFVGAIAGGRGWTRQQARALADGRIHVGAAAQTLGLVDRLGTFDDVLARRATPVLVVSGAAARMASNTETNQAAPGSGTGFQPVKHGQDAHATSEAVEIAGQACGKGHEMSTEEAVAKAQAQAQEANQARVKALREAFAEDPAFALQAIAEGWDLSTAKANYADKLAADLKASRAENAASRAEVEQLKASKAAPPKAAGNKPLATEKGEGPTETSPRARFQTLIAAEMAQGASRAQAVQRITAREPELHRALVAEANAGKTEALAQSAAFAN